MPRSIKLNHLVLLALALISFQLFLFPTKIYSSELDLGAGVLVFKAHHYRGSDETKTYTIPYPYIKYQSRRVEAETSAVRFVFFDSSRLSVKLSMNAGLKVDSEDSKARSGMPELNYTFELGPAVIFHLIRTKELKLQLESFARRVFETDFSYTNDIGWSLANYVNLIITKDRYNIEAYLGALYGDRELQDYYYTVNDEFATPNRPQYRSTSGFAGYTFIIVYRIKLGPIIISPFYRYDDLSHMKNADSPLVKRNSYSLFGSSLVISF